MYKVFVICFKLDVALVSVFKENFITAINSYVKSAELLASYFERALISDKVRNKNFKILFEYY